MLQNRLKLQPLRIDFNHAREDFSVHFPKASNTKREHNHFNLFPNNTRNRTNEILIENPRLRLRRTKNYCHPKMCPSVNVTAWLTWKRSWRRAQRCSFKKNVKSRTPPSIVVGRFAIVLIVFFITREWWRWIFPLCRWNCSRFWR